MISRGSGGGRGAPLGGALLAPLAPGELSVQADPGAGALLWRPSGALSIARDPCVQAGSGQGATIGPLVTMTSSSASLEPERRPPGGRSLAVARFDEQAAPLLRPFAQRGSTWSRCVRAEGQTRPPPGRRPRRPRPTESRADWIPASRVFVSQPVARSSAFPFGVMENRVYTPRQNDVVWASGAGNETNGRSGGPAFWLIIRRPVDARGPSDLQTGGRRRSPKPSVRLRPTVNGTCCSKVVFFAPNDLWFGCCPTGMCARIASWNSAWPPFHAPPSQTARRVPVKSPLRGPSRASWSS